MPTAIKGRDWQDWEIYSSTRQATALWTKIHPVDITLTTPGTAQDLILIIPVLATVNVAANPSFETGDPPTGYTNSGAVGSQSAIVARNGTNSILINPNNAATGEGVYWTSDFLASTGEASTQDYLVVSAYFQDNINSGDTVRIEIRNATGTTTHATGNTVTLTNAWQRSVARFPLPNIGAAYRIYFVTVAQHNTNFYVDSFQVELQQSSNATDYCDGTLGLNYEWYGTSHASMSRRRGNLVAIRGYDLHITRDVYLSFDAIASSTTG